MSREMAVERMWLFGKAFCIYDDTPGYNPPFRSMCMQSTRYFLFKINIAQNKSRLLTMTKAQDFRCTSRISTMAAIFPDTLSGRHNVGK